MSGLAKRIGPYLHAEGMRADLTFEGGRSFTVVMAGAYDANGLVGPEHNGLAVIDVDNDAVVLEGHMREGSGYFGPSTRQKAEFERVASIADWKEFTSYLRGNPRYRRNSVPDLDQDNPDAPDLSQVVLKAARNKTLPNIPGPSILPDEAVAAHGKEEAPYEFPLRTKADIAAFLAGHAYHGDGRGPRHLAWDIKVHSFDTGGRVEGFEHQPDPAFDGLWAAYVKANAHHLHQQAAGDGLRPYLDGEATSYLGDQGDFTFSVGGRSGGWLELTEFKGTKLGFDSLQEVIETYLGMDDEDLARLYVGVVCFDKDIDPEQEMAYQFAALREGKEAEWASPEAAEEEAAELGVEGFVHPGAAAPAP
jgi:hypothetical protein